MAKHRTYSIEFKRQVAQEFLAGESLHGLSRRHDVSRNLIRVWVAKLEAGTYDEDAKAADLLQEYEAKIAALERLVGRQALEIEFLKGVYTFLIRPDDLLKIAYVGHKASRDIENLEPAFPKYRRYSVRREGDSAIRIMKL